MSEFEVVRSTDVAADPARVHDLVNDFHRWTEWSPWEDLDPQLARTYSGPDSGIGAHYAWVGNRRAGRGSMEITGSAPDRIDIRLAFLKPYTTTNDVTFTMTPTQVDGAAGTSVEWRMSGRHQGILGVVSRIFPMDRLIGKDFEKGLTRLKAVAETG
jgi:hypothetical protein